MVGVGGWEGGVGCELCVCGRGGVVRRRGEWGWVGRRGGRGGCNACDQDGRVYGGCVCNVGCPVETVAEGGLVRGRRGGVADVDYRVDPVHEGGLNNVDYRVDPVHEGRSIRCMRGGFTTWSIGSIRCMRGG